MKYAFILSTLCLLAAGYVIDRSLPDTATDRPVLYWVTDANPARHEQVRLFHDWRRKQNLPEVQLRLDTSNNDDTKKIVQGVSGVGGDILDIWNGATMRYYRAVGLLRDVTTSAKELGFDPSKTYASVLPEIAIEEDGQWHQYMFPCNVVPSLYFVNKETVAKAGIGPLPERWTVDTFEAMGKQFVAAANPPGTRRRVFWADAVDRTVLYRSLGASELNETCTASAFDDERVIRSLSLVYKWTFRDRLIPSNADRQSFSSDSGYGGSSPQLFESGYFGLMVGGRHLFIQFREFDKTRKAQGRSLTDVTAVEPPYFAGGMPNIPVGTRAAAVYAGGKHPELASQFLAFLASEEYNMQIVRDADSLPPSPIYAKTPEFLRPPDHPNEWGVHEIFARAAENTAIAGTYSPFILTREVERETGRAYDELMNDRISVEDAVRQAHVRINTGIQRTLQENPKLQHQYDSLLQIQKQIDTRRATGQKVPEAWLKNPVHRAYYRFKGWSE